MRSEWVETDMVKVILALLLEPNRLAVEMSIRHGMRIGDVLATRTEDVKHGNWTYKEQKTGKRRRVTTSDREQQQLLAQAGRIYIFEHRLDYRKHRTRQAVYKDIKRATKVLRLERNFTPHSARKVYAVSAYKRYGLKRVKRLLNHSSEAVTQIYALADELSTPGGLGARKPPL